MLYVIIWRYGEAVSDCFRYFVNVLVVACPCSLGLATPLCMVVAIGNASKNGIVIKSSESIERINQIDTVVFDKTGTLTKGEMEIAESKFLGDKAEYLNILQSLEEKSSHPLAKGICRSGVDLFERFEVEDFEEIAGLGISGKIQGMTYFAGNRKLFEIKSIKNIFEKEATQFAKNGESVVYFGGELGMFGVVGLKDTIKPTTKTMLLELKEKKKKLVMLSGDDYRTAIRVGEELAIDEVFAERDPKNKLEKMKELNQRQNVLMVGDGINDSPSLRSAAIGVSVANRNRY